MIAGVQNKTGAISLLSLSPLPPLNRSGLKLVCIVNPPSLSCATATNYRLKPKTKDNSLQTTTDCRRQAKDSRLQTTDFRLKTIELRLQTIDYRLQTTENRLQTTDFRRQTTDSTYST